MQVHQILAIQKLGLDYAWFNLITTRQQKLNVYDNGIGWVIDESNKEAEIVVNEYDEMGQVMKCTIYGKREQINNLMHSIGLSVPSIISDSVYMATIIDLKNKLDYLISEVNELKNAKETTA
jgi:hypothetical protein